MTNSRAYPEPIHNFFLLIQYYLKDSLNWDEMMPEKAYVNTNYTPKKINKNTLIEDATIGETER